MSSTVSTSSERFTGRVKWFNNKAGYGFVTVTDGSKSGTDVFAHHTVINTASEQYKYLVMGEYVSFEVLALEGKDHEYQATNISGINGGKLMCETRQESRAARYQYSSEKSSTDAPKSVSVPRSRDRDRDQDRDRDRDRDRRSTRDRYSDRDQDRGRERERDRNRDRDRDQDRRSTRDRSPQKQSSKSKDKSWSYVAKTTTKTA